ncbi:MAG: hypothetical protein QE269_12680 [Fimbriimonas sp.]|nr:hypothetical protein [Fimbriimonas sp.]
MKNYWVPFSHHGGTKLAAPNHRVNDVETGGCSDGFGSDAGSVGISDAARVNGAFSAFQQPNARADISGGIGGWSWRIDPSSA